MFDVSAIICTHNPRPDYLHRVLNSLHNQTLSKERWELLLIDNASETPIQSAYDTSWHPHARHLRETVLGHAAARLCGIREALTDLLVFIDDDNVLEPEYLSTTIKIKQEWSQLGVWGSGAIVPEFESNPPEYLKRHISYLAIREIAAPRWTNIAIRENALCKDSMPWGAGMCVRANVAAAYARLSHGSIIRISGRRGASLLCGDDLEISLVSCKLGFGIGIFPELKLTHLIPKVRIREEYLVKLAEGTAVSDCLLRYKWLNIHPRSSFSTLGILGLVKNVFYQRGIDRRMYFAHRRANAKAKDIIAGSTES